MADPVGLGVQTPSLQEALQPISSMLTIQGQKEDVKQKQFKTKADFAQKANEIMGGLIQDPRISSGDSKQAISALTEAVTLAEKYGIPKEEAISFAAPLYSVAQHAPKNLQQVLANSITGGLGASGVAGQNLVSAGNQAQYVTNPITGAPMPVGRTQFGAPTGVVPTQQRPGVPQPAQPSTQSQGMGGSGGQPSLRLSSQPLAQQANESPENFNARVKNVMNTFDVAQDQQSNVNSQFGHIPTIKTINNNILGLLKDESVDTGAVQKFLAGKTNYATLSPKEQELSKYLEQRIQNLSSKSDKDAESKKMAYGSLGMKKEALMDLVRQDNAWVTQQDLLSKGRINAAGNPSNPNTGRLADFNNKFAVYAQNPQLMKYVSMVGENPNTAKLDKHDVSSLQKNFGNMSKDDLARLEKQRQELLQLIGAK